MSQRVPVDRDVMVVGGSPDAGWAVRELLGLGYQVHWLAPEGAAPDWPAEGLLSVHSGAALAGLQGQVGRFRATVQVDGRAEEVPVAALVVATGNQRVAPDAGDIVALGGPLCSLAEMARQLAAPPDVRQMAPHRDERAAVLLDARRDTSKEMACEALNLALRLRREWFCEVWVLYSNLRVDSPGLEALTREMREQGVVFCRYDELSTAVRDDGITLDYVDGPLDVDRVVLPEAIRPAVGTAELAARLQVRLGADGFFQDVNIHQLRPGLSNRRGIFFAGRCHMDGDEADFRGDAVQVAASVDALLGKGYLEPDAVIAEVDPDKCIRCLTCVRSCPHKAVEVMLYPEREVTAARVDEWACQGCGACVCNCPVQAIELQGQAMPAWSQSQA